MSELELMIGVIASLPAGTITSTLLTGYYIDHAKDYGERSLSFREFSSYWKNYEKPAAVVAYNYYRLGMLLYQEENSRTS